MSSAEEHGGSISWGLPMMVMISLILNTGHMESEDRDLRSSLIPLFPLTASVGECQQKPWWGTWGYQEYLKRASWAEVESLVRSFPSQRGPSGFILWLGISKACSRSYSPVFAGDPATSSQRFISMNGKLPWTAGQGFLSLCTFQ